MSQTTLDDDELFGEAAEEVRADVEEALAAARAELPDAEAVWAVDGENTLGVLNGLRSKLEVEGVETHLRDAKKWYTMGERANAFEDGDDLATEIEALEATLDDLEETRELVGELTGQLPALREALSED
ncbi:MAG: DUF5790 family protein [Halobacteriaceae archaeon]